MQQASVQLVMYCIGDLCRPKMFVPMDYLDISEAKIVVSSEESGCVLQAVQDLQEYVESATGRTLSISSLASLTPGDVVIVAGFAAACAAGLDDMVPDALGDQGYVLRTTELGAHPTVLASGLKGRGSAFALIELVKSIAIGEGRVSLATPFNVVEKPKVAKRGLYAHQRWTYNYPYAVRTWSLEEWRRFIDLLAYMKINCLLIPICGDPLSENDQSYLKQCSGIIEYARENRGMEVWIGDGPVDVPEEPGDSERFAAKMHGRSNLFCLVGDADGFWVTDSAANSPGDFVRLLSQDRGIIDECASRNAKLAYWMWRGWGSEGQSENWRSVIKGMEDRLHEPWWLMPCSEEHLQVVQERGHLAKSLFFSYGTVDEDSNPPLTRLRFRQISSSLDIMKANKGLAGVIGNVQTPLAQLPNLFHFAECAWSGPEREANGKKLRELARLVAPESADALAAGWGLLDENEPEKVLAGAADLQKLVAKRQVGRPGPIGRLLFPDHTRALHDLHLQLRTHGWARRVVKESAAVASAADMLKPLTAYHNAALRWRQRHGFSRNLLYGSDVQQVSEAWKEYRKKQSVSKSLLKEVIAGLLKEGHELQYIEQVLQQTPANC